MKTLALVLLLASQCLSQAIEFDVTSVKVTTGLNNPKIVGNAVLYDADSKPEAVNAGYVKSKVASGELELWVFGTEGQGFGDPRSVGDGEWVILGKGKYQVILQVIEGGKSRKSSPKNLLISESNDPVTPDETLSTLSKDARVVVREFVANMAGDMDKLSSSAAANKFSTVLQASAAMNLYDAETRNKFKARMGELMQPRLGSGQLPADATKTFHDIATGFKGVK